MGPPGFPPPNVQNNQNYNRYNQNQGRGQNFNQGNNNFQAPNYQAQVGPSNDKSPRFSSLPSNTVAKPESDVKAITTRSGVFYDGPMIPPTPSPLLKEVERETKAIKDKLDECLALADLGASINLMPLSVWKKLLLPEHTPLHDYSKLVDRSVPQPKGVCPKMVFVKVGKFYIPVNFVVVDYDVDPRVPLILERPFLRTVRALIDYNGEELLI
ncbi:reverse transcriptase domain-containing protein [Tanacetum coccineum]